MKRLAAIAAAMLCASCSTGEATISAEHWKAAESACASHGGIVAAKTSAECSVRTRGSCKGYIIITVTGYCANGINTTTTIKQ